MFESRLPETLAGPHTCPGFHETPGIYLYNEVSFWFQMDKTRLLSLVTNRLKQYRTLFQL